MPTRQSSPHSLTMRIALLMLGFLLAGMWTLVWYADHRLREDMREQLQAHQQTLAALLARELDRTLAERSSALQAVARSLLTAAPLAEEVPTLERLQTVLPRLSVLQQMFSGGYFVTDAQGLAIVSYPAHLLGQRRMFMSSQATNGALAGETVVSGPMAGLVEGRPVLVIAVPVPGPDGRVAGALVGVVKLRDAGLLQPLPEVAGQPAPGYLVVGRTSRAIVASDAEQRILQSLPAPGQDLALDALLSGAEGSVLHTEQGREMLSSVQLLRPVDWAVLISQPTALVYAPLESVQRRILLAALLLTLLAAAGVWWMLRRALHPLLDIGQRLGAMAEKGAPLQPLQAQNTHELAQLVHGCNHLLTEIDRRQQALQESRQLYKAAFQISPDTMDITRVSDGVHLLVNASFERLFGWSRAEVLHHSSVELGIWRAADMPRREQFVRQVLAQGSVSGWEQQLWRRDGTPVTVLMGAHLLDVAGEACMLWVCQDVTASRAAADRIQRLSSTDQLTGLPNMQQFVQLLEQVQARCLQTQRLAALLCIDLDDFKTINDSLGHEHGDQLLRQTGQRISAQLRPGDLLARLGGDEFLLLLPDLPPPLGAAAQQAEALAQRLSAELGQPLTIEGTTHGISVGMGITVLGQEHQEPRELLRQAVLALNQAKATGRGAMLLFEPQMQAEVNSRARLQRSLREALQQQNFVLHYQPQLCSDGTVVGVEALVRWPLPGQGMVSPGEFIPLAEKTGLIVPLGRWVLHCACSQLAQWAREPQRRQLDIAVNVSAGQFQQDDFVATVQEVLQQTGAPAERLKIELTESLMMYDIQPIIERMNALRALGVRFSLDDFGTGFSSLAYLKRLPLQQLKIDQGFVRDCLEDHNDAAIARTVIALGESLGLQVIAEGVETPAHRAALAQWGCRFFQGYLFSRPLPIAQLEEFLQLHGAPAPVPASD